MENSDHLIQIPAGTFVDAVARAVRGALLAGEDVAIPGLGNFNVLYEESRLDQDGTGEDVLLPPRNTVSFEPESVS